MMNYLRKATAATIMFGPFVDKTDGVTLKTDGTTITDIDHATTGIFLSKAGATAAIRNGTPTASVADAYGMMKVTLNTTDTGTTGSLDVLFAKAATYLPVHKSFMVLEQVVYDVLFGTVALATTTNITAGTIATVTNQLTGAAIADALLDRNMATGVDSGTESIRTPRQAFRHIRNHWFIEGLLKTVTKEDDTTVSWTSTVTPAPGADPISGDDPT